MGALSWLDRVLGRGAKEEDSIQSLRKWMFYYNPEMQQLVPPLIVNEKDGSILVWIPPGEFEMGDRDGQDSHRLKHRVFLDGYYLGVHCITNRQYQHFVEETGHRPPDKSSTMGDTPIWQGRSYPATHAKYPVVCVSWKDAQAYCTWAGLALPTEAQWERGARGPGNLIYPWGNGWDANKCRNISNKDNSITCVAFAYPQGASGFGTLNQSGNVWEWCRDWFDNGYYSKSPAHNPEGPTTGSSRVLRGGSYGIGRAEDIRTAYRDYGDPADRRDFLGFRPCLPPGQQPG